MGVRGEGGGGEEEEKLQCISAPPETFRAVAIHLQAQDTRAYHL